MHKRPKITVVTVTYNAEKFLEPTLKSVIRQRYDKLEYIIVDGKSTDGTMDIVNRYRSSVNRVICEPDRGIYDAMNKGLMHATGEWIIFMNAGDAFYDDKVLARVFSREYPEGCGLIFGDAMNYSRSIQVKRLFSPAARWWGEENAGNGEATYLKTNPACHQSTFMRTSLHREHPFQWQAFPIAADWNAMVAMLDAGHKYEYVQEPIAWYDVEGVSSSVTFSSLRERELISRQKMGMLRKLIAVFSFRLRRTIKLFTPPHLLYYYVPDFTPLWAMKNYPRLKRNGWVYKALSISCQTQTIHDLHTPPYQYRCPGLQRQEASPPVPGFLFKTDIWRMGSHSGG